jgi:Right handed beta helix region
MTHRFALTTAAMTLGMLFVTAPAQAQFAVFISGDGNDGNSCLTPAAACRTLAIAQTTVASGGVIHVLPGEYSSVEITKSVQIIADGGQASIAGSTVSADGVAAAIVVNAGPTDVVKIRGMIFDRHGSLAGGGVGLVAGGALHIEKCTLVNAGANFGLHFRPSGNSELVVSNSTIANNVGGGIEVQPGAGGAAHVTIDRTRLLNNGRGILAVNGSNVIMRNSTITGNTIGVRVGAAAVVRMADSTVSGNTTGLSPTGNSQIVSHRGNVVADNSTDGAFTSTVNQQ